MAQFKGGCLRDLAVSAFHKIVVQVYAYKEIMPSVLESAGASLGQQELKEAGIFVSPINCRLSCEFVSCGRKGWDNLGTDEKIQIRVS